MFLNEDFLRVYEELSELNEGKLDTQKLVDFAGEDLAKRFFLVKNRLKSPENDLYYWIKNKTPEELEAAIQALETTKSKTQTKKATSDDAKLVAENNDWKVYHITSYEASQKYGRDTRWCITGASNQQGEHYWDDYHKNRGVEFYFFIAKENYNTRGVDSKYALAVWPIKKAYQIFNQQDHLIQLSEAPFIKELKIPGVDLSTMEYFSVPDTVDCKACGETVDTDDYYLTAKNDTEFYHEICWYKTFKPEGFQNLTEVNLSTDERSQYKVLNKDKALKFIIDELKDLGRSEKDYLMLHWSWVKETSNPTIAFISGGELTEISDPNIEKQLTQALQNIK